MSKKDMLGPLTRALVGVPAKMLGLVLDIANRLGSADAESFYSDLAKFVRSWKKVTAQAGYVLDTFFQTRGGLWVSENFRSLVVAKAQPAEAVAMREFNLTRDMLDSEIEAELGEGHIWDESRLCSTLKTLIEEQWGGKSGTLLNNGYANLFYTSSCVVDVRWYSDDRRWFVSTWQRDDNRWLAGYRVFSPATTT